MAKIKIKEVEARLEPPGSYEVSKPDLVKYWVASGPGVVHYGVNDTNQVTTTGQPNFEFFDDEQGQLNALDDLISQLVLPDLPQTGDAVEEGVIYVYGDSTVKCRQAHNRTEHEPSEIPALFSVIRDPGENMDWIEQEQVYVGDRRDYNGTMYECLQSHQTQSDWTPNVTPALWSVFTAADPGVWAPRLVVAIDDELEYEGEDYACLQAHTTQVGWEPANTLGVLWGVVASGTEWAPGQSVTVGDVRAYLGLSYECRQSHTTQVGWEPPNVLALWLPL